MVSIYHGASVTTRTLWLDWSRVAGQPRTEQCRAFRDAACEPGHVWSEHFDVDVEVEIAAPRKPRQRRSTLDLRGILSLALDAIIGPIVASPARVASVHVAKRWDTNNNPGVAITVRTHRPDGPESEST